MGKHLRWIRLWMGLALAGCALTAAGQQPWWDPFTPLPPDEKAIKKLTADYQQAQRRGLADSTQLMRLANLMDAYGAQGELRAADSLRRLLQPTAAPGYLPAQWALLRHELRQGRYTQAQARMQSPALARYLAALPTATPTLTGWHHLQQVFYARFYSTDLRGADSLATLMARYLQGWQAAAPVADKKLTEMLTAQIPFELKVMRAQVALHRGVAQGVYEELKAVTDAKYRHPAGSKDVWLAHAYLLLAQEASQPYTGVVTLAAWPRAEKNLAAAFGPKSAPALLARIAHAQALRQSPTQQRAALKRELALEKTLTRLEKKGATASTPYLQLALAQGQLAQKRWVNARALATRGLTLLRARGDSLSPWTHDAYRMYMATDQIEGRLPVALLYAQEALNLAQQHTGPHTTRTADAQARLAQLKLADYRAEQAEGLARAALTTSAAQRRHTHPDHIFIERTHAQALLGLSQLDSAVSRMTRARGLTAAHYGATATQLARAGTELAQLLLRRGALEAIPALLDTTLANFIEKEYYPLDEADILETYAQYHELKANYPKAEELLLRALKLRKRAGDGDLTTGSTTDLANLYIAQGRYSEAKALLQRTTALYAQTGTRNEGYLKALGLLSSLYVRTGQFTEAEQTGRQAVSLAASLFTTSSLQHAAAQVQLASVLTDMGRYADAGELLRTALQRYTALYGADNINTARLLAQTGTNALYQGDAVAAQGFFLSGLRAAEVAVGRESLEYVQLERGLAELYMSVGRLTPADTLLNHVLLVQIARQGRKHPDYLATSALLGRLYVAEGRLKEAADVYTEVLAGWKAALGANHPDYAGLQAEYADLLFRQGKRKPARDTYDQALAGLLAQVERYFPALSEQEKADFWAQLSPRLDRFYLFALAEGAADPTLLTRAYDLRLATKALLMTQTTALRSRIMASGDATLIDLFSQWQAQRERLAKALTTSEAELKAQGISLPGMETEVNELERELSQRSEAFASRSRSKPITWQQVQRALGANEAAVEVLRLRSGGVAAADSVVYAALVLKPGGTPQAVSIPGSNLLERRYYLQYARAISNHFTDKNSYARYWAPLEPALQGAQTVYASLDGAYTQMALTALSAGDSTYLIDKYHLRLVTNTRELVTTASRTTYGGEAALLVGNPDYTAGARGPVYDVPPLEGTRREVGVLDSLLAQAGWQRETLTEAQATEENLKLRPGTPVMHIATHGFFLQVAPGGSLGTAAPRALANPLHRSGLLLAGAARSLAQEPLFGGVPGAADTTAQPTENGILTAYEVLNLNLDATQLVVLSACETGLGEVRSGEGVYGLQRAFQVAGAKNLIMSLWRVNDAVTQELISQFYLRWARQHQPPAEAFRQAQLHIRQKYPDPYYWGAFVMLGR